MQALDRHSAVHDLFRRRASAVHVALGQIALDSMLVVWDPQCEVPVIRCVPFQASATATGDQPAEDRTSGQ